MGKPKLSEAQRRILSLIADRPNALRENDKCSSSWWIEAGPPISKPTAITLLGKGLIELTWRPNGLSGTRCYSITPAGRAAIEET